jgi:hypothetical protein
MRRRQGAARICAGCTGAHHPIVRASLVWIGVSAAALAAAVRAAPEQPPAARSCTTAVCENLGPAVCAGDELVHVTQMCAAVSAGCIDAACAQVGGLPCQTPSQMERVATACQENFAGDCLQAACRHADLMCSNVDALVRVLDACVANPDGRCVDEVCDRAGPLACNSLDEVTRVARACAARQQPRYILPRP